MSAPHTGGPRLQRQPMQSHSTGSGQVFAANHTGNERVRGSDLAHKDRIDMKFDLKATLALCLARLVVRLIGRKRAWRLVLGPTTEVQRDQQHELHHSHRRKSS